jgi:hypothetical protein
MDGYGVLLGGALTAGIGAVGYLLKNAMEKTSEGNTVNVYKALLELHQGLSGSGKTLEDLDEFNTAVQKANIFRPDALRRDEVVNKVSIDGKFETTYDMDKRLSREIADARTRVQRAMQDLEDLDHGLPDELLRQTQARFEDYVQACADLEAKRWEGGTIRPIMVGGRILSLVSKRAEELELELHYRRLQ